MIQDLPVEVIEKIVGHLSSASSIVNLASTNRELHSIVLRDSILRQFIQRAFPTIDTPPQWKDFAHKLTSRSRAWDRRAFIARECYPPDNSIDHEPGGYPPAVDCYEAWPGTSKRKEFLAWGAAGRLCTRTIRDGITTWSSYRTLGDRSPELDILDVRILRPHQQDSQDSEVETIVFLRANRELVKVETTLTPNVFGQKSRYVPPSDAEYMCMDVSSSANPLLVASGGPLSINLYPLNSAEKLVEPTSSVTMHQQVAGIWPRIRCVKFLAETTIAAAKQRSGPCQAQLNVYDVRPSGLSTIPRVTFGGHLEGSRLATHSMNTIANLDGTRSTASQPGQVFLTGWTDGVSRLYDTRQSSGAVATYVDTVDDGQILSLLTVGHERFMAGGSQSGCLKIFDLRMTGARAYSYLDARPAQAMDIAPAGARQRDINIFLTPPVNYNERLWEPLPHRPSKRSSAYRGSVYSLASPSPSSPTIYAGISNHVLQLDFASTDDIRSQRLSPAILDANTYPSGDKTRAGQQHILNLSCYERPREGRESTDPVLLRKQVDLSSALKNGRQNGLGSGGLVEEGWDERMRLNTATQRRGVKSESGPRGGRW